MALTSLVPAPSPLLAGALAKGRHPGAFQAEWILFESNWSPNLDLDVMVRWLRYPRGLPDAAAEKARARARARGAAALRPWIKACVAAADGLERLKISYPRKVAADAFAKASADPFDLGAFTTAVRDGASRLLGSEAGGSCRIQVEDLDRAGQPDLCDLQIEVDSPDFTDERAEIHTRPTRLPGWEALQRWIGPAAKFEAQWTWEADSAHGRAARIKRLTEVPAWL